jgi:hypothetical protein
MVEDIKNHVIYLLNNILVSLPIIDLALKNKTDSEDYPSFKHAQPNTFIKGWLIPEKDIRLDYDVSKIPNFEIGEKIVVGLDNVNSRSNLSRLREIKEYCNNHQEDIYDDLSYEKSSTHLPRCNRKALELKIEFLLNQLNYWIRRDEEELESTEAGLLELHNQLLLEELKKAINEANHDEYLFLAGENGFKSCIVGQMFAGGSLNSLEHVLKKYNGEKSADKKLKLGKIFYDIFNRPAKISGACSRDE